jgi:ribosomal protein S18 acetylase RimI-like enzyme
MERGSNISDAEIRDAEPGDRTAITDLILALNRHENGISGDRRTDRASAVACFRDDIDKMREHGGIRLVAVTGNMVCAYMCCVISEGGPFLREDKRRYGYITTLVVDEAHRGLGLGVKLVSAAETFTRSQGLTSLGVSVLSGNTGAEQLYARMGMVPYMSERFKPLD